MKDIELGRQALTYFHNMSRNFTAYQPRTVDELIALYGSKKGPIYLEGIGLAISSNSMTERQIKAAMENLAYQTRGKIPADHQAYVRALGNKAGEISYLDLTKQVVADVVKESADGLASFGENLKTILSIANTALPFVVLWLGYKYVVAKGKSIK